MELVETKQSLLLVEMRRQVARASRTFEILIFRSIDDGDQTSSGQFPSQHLWSHESVETVRNLGKMSMGDADHHLPFKLRLTLTSFGSFHPFAAVKTSTPVFVTKRVSSN